MNWLHYKLIWPSKRSSTLNIKNKLGFCLLQWKLVLIDEVCVLYLNTGEKESFFIYIRKPRMCLFNIWGLCVLYLRYSHPDSVLTDPKFYYLNSDPGTPDILFRSGSRIGSGSRLIISGLQRIMNFYLFITRIGPVLRAGKQMNETIHIYFKFNKFLVYFLL